jgi:hypothetical protein
MKISDSQREKLGYAEEELKGLAHLMKQIVDHNSDGSVDR